MTVYGWDGSNHDDPIRVRDGIDFYTHKIGEGHWFYYDREYRASLENARALGIPILGAYYVNHPGVVADQVDWFVELLDQDTPWWRTHPAFVLQIDAEKFDYMDRAPDRVEIQAFGDRLVKIHGVDPRKILAYAPQWLYGNSLTGLSYRLWASGYGGNPYAHYLDAYPGDHDGKRWQAYSGQTPLILQYGSNTTIGDQTTCDANAYRGDLGELLAELGAGGNLDQMPTGDFQDENEEDDMVRGVIAQRTGQGIVQVYPHPLTGEMVTANVGYGEMVAAWKAAGWGDSTNLDGADEGRGGDLSALGRPATAVAAEIIAALAAGAFAPPPDQSPVQIDAAEVARLILADEDFRKGIAAAVLARINLVQGD